MKRKRVAVMVVLVLALAGTALAQQGKGRRAAAAESDGGLFPGCPLNLNLSQEQTAKLQESRNAFFKDTTDLRADMFKKEQELDAVMIGQNVDKEKARKLQTEISDLRGKFAQKALDAQIAARAVLTPEQVQQLPPGCNLGIGPGGKGCGMGMGCGMGRGPGRGAGNW